MGTRDNIHNHITVTSKYINYKMALKMIFFSYLQDKSVPSSMETVKENRAVFLG